MQKIRNNFKLKILESNSEVGENEEATFPKHKQLNATLNFEIYDTPFAFKSNSRNVDALILSSTILELGSFKNILKGLFRDNGFGFDSYSLRVYLISIVSGIHIETMLRNFLNSTSFEYFSKST